MTIERVPSSHCEPCDACAWEVEPCDACLQRGALMVVLDADANRESITLHCDGTNWRVE